MYLCDKDIKLKLPELDIETSNSEFPFEPEVQIQPCSIDFKLNNVFWVPKKRITIDLIKSKLLEIHPRRYYRKIVLKKGEFYTLKPGKTIFSSIYENITIPSDCAGKISGRSSFARLGIMVHLTGDFINPGYRGHMPLQIVNLSSNSIKIFPYLPICQMQLVKLSGVPERFYGNTVIQSKYMNDDGGPSYWWRDQRIKKLQDIFSQVDLSISIQNSILEIIGNQEPEIIERLEKRISKCKQSEIENCSSILNDFAKYEDRRRMFRKIGIYSARGLFPILFSASIGILFTSPYNLMHYIIWIITVLSISITIYAFSTEVGSHLGKYELEKIESQKEIP